MMEARYSWPWACGACTFLNTPAVRACSICGTAAPSSATATPRHHRLPSAADADCELIETGAVAAVAAVGPQAGAGARAVPGSDDDIMIVIDDAESDTLPTPPTARSPPCKRAKGALKAPADGQTVAEAEVDEKQSAQRAERRALELERAAEACLRSSFAGSGSSTASKALMRALAQIRTSRELQKLSVDVGDDIYCWRVHMPSASFIEDFPSLMLELDAYVCALSRCIIELILWLSCIIHGCAPHLIICVPLSCLNRQYLPAVTYVERPPHVGKRVATLRRDAAIVAEAAIRLPLPLLCGVSE